MLAQPARAVAIAIAKVNFFIFNMDFFLSFSIKVRSKISKNFNRSFVFYKISLFSRKGGNWI